MGGGLLPAASACPALVDARYGHWLFMAFGDRWRRLPYDGIMSDTTPLAKRLGLSDGMLVWFDNVPEHIDDEIAEYALDLFIAAAPQDAPYASLLFVETRADMEIKLRQLRDTIHKSGFIWTCWPQNAPDIDAERVREFADSLGYIDTKSCAIDDIWSGLKLVIRKELR